MDEVHGSNLMAGAGHDDTEDFMNQDESEAEGTVTTNVNPAPVLSSVDNNANAKAVDIPSDEEEDDEDADMCLCLRRAACCEFCDWVEFNKRCWLDKLDDSDECFDLFDIAGWASCRCDACWRELDRNGFYIPIVRSHSHESSYMNTNHSYRRYHARSSSESSPRALYDRSTAQELQHFVHNRGLDDPLPGHLTMKFYYIVALQRADRKWTFDFLGLPAEVRLEVYRCLLVNDCAAERHEAILRTSKLINKESSDVLYGENVVRCELRSWSRLQNLRIDQKRHVARKDDFETMWSFGPYPRRFRNIHQLEIHLKYHSGVWAYEEVTAYLTVLASSLMDGHSLKRLKIILTVDQCLRGRCFEAMMYPLSRLRNIPKVEIEGEVSQQYGLQLVAEMQSSEPCFNTFKYMRLLLDESSHQIDLLKEAMGQGSYGPSDSESTTPRIKQLAKLCQSVLKCRKKGFSSSSREHDLHLKLVVLRDALNGMNISSTKVLLEITASARAARQAIGRSTVLDDAKEKWKDDLISHYANEASAGRIYQL